MLPSACPQIADQDDHVAYFHSFGNISSNQAEDYRHILTRQMLTQSEHERNFTYHGHVTNTIPFTSSNPSPLAYGSVSMRSRNPGAFESGIFPVQQIQCVSVDPGQGQCSHDPRGLRIQPTPSVNYRTKILLPSFRDPSGTLSGASPATIGCTLLNAETFFLSSSFKSPPEFSPQFSPSLVSNPFGEGYYPRINGSGPNADPIGRIVDEPYYEIGFLGNPPSSQPFPGNTHGDPSPQSRDNLFISPQSSNGLTCPVNQPSKPTNLTANYSVWDSKTGYPVQESKKKRRPTLAERNETRIMRSTGACPGCRKDHRRVRLVVLIPRFILIIVSAIRLIAGLWRIPLMMMHL